MRASLLHGLGLAATLSTVSLGASTADAQSHRPQFRWPWEHQGSRSAPTYRPARSHRESPQEEAAPTYRPAPSYRSSPSAETTESYRSSSNTQVTEGYRPAPSATTETYRSVPSTSSSNGYRPAAPMQAQPSPQSNPPQPAEPPRQTVQAQAAARPAPAARAVQPAPNNAQYLQQAIACMNEKKTLAPDAVVKSCDAVIDETIRNLANAYYFRGGATLALQDYEGAIASYTQAIKLDPMQSEYLTGRASAYEGKNEFDRAMADYNAAIKIDPKSAYAYNNRGAAFQRKGDYARAAADYGEVTRLQPNNLDAWSARCWVRAVSPGQTQQALNDCNQALKIRPDAPDVLDTRGFIYLKLGQGDNALKDFDAALRYDPKLAGSLYGRGLVKIKKGDADGGKTDVAAAKAIRADIAEEFARYGVR